MILVVIYGELLLTTIFVRDSLVEDKWESFEKWNFVEKKKKCLSNFSMILKFTDGTDDMEAGLHVSQFL